ncbi:MAG: hypothetical protein ACK5MV_00225 [Aminipila sp.]
MAVPRAKKSKKKTKTEKQRKVEQEFIKAEYLMLARMVIYAYLADVKKFKQSDLKDIERFYASTALALSNPNNEEMTVEKIDEILKKHGTDFEQLMLDTNKFLDGYEGEWK